VIRFAHGARTDSGPLDEFIWIDRDPIELRVDDDHALRVRIVPGPTHWVFKTMRYHEEEYVIAHHTTHYRGGHYDHSDTRYTPVVGHVGEDGCAATFDQQMHDGEVYFFEYTYVSPENCSVTCLRGTRGTDGQVVTTPCDGLVQDAVD
jgi:hypothetical protein